jgi:hypothetical protein
MKSVICPWIDKMLDSGSGPTWVSLSELESQFTAGSMDKAVGKLKKPPKLVKKKDQYFRLYRDLI